MNQRMSFRFLKRDKEYWYVRGVFTVEAAYLIPVSLILFAFLFQLSVDFTQTIHTASQEVAALQEVNTLHYFLMGSQVDGVKELLLGGK